jgi:hypothetical protein
MKTLLIVNTHSIIDVITNSSSELFVCKTDKTVEMVKEILAADPNVYGYNEPVFFDLQEYRKWRKLERERIKNWQQGDKEPNWANDSVYRDIEGWFPDDEDEHDIKESRINHIEDYDNVYRNRIDDCQNLETDWTKKNALRNAEVQKIYTEIENSFKKPMWWDKPIQHGKYGNTPVKELDGCVIITSEDDNSMPFDHFDWIENVFNARRYHLG